MQHLHCLRGLLRIEPTASRLYANFVSEEKNRCRLLRLTPIPR